MALADAVADPVESHVDGFGAALLDCVIGDAGAASIVDDDWSSWLRVAHFGESSTHGDGFFTIEECGAGLGFGGSGHDDVHDGAEGVYSSIVRRGWCVGTGGDFRVSSESSEKVITAGAAAGCGFGTVRGITVEGKSHITGVVADSCIGMSGAVVEEMCECSSGGFSSFGLSGGEVADSYKHGGIDGASIVEECTDGLLEACDAGGIEGW